MKREQREYVTFRAVSTNFSEGGAICRSLLMRTGPLPLSYISGRLTTHCLTDLNH